MACPRLTFALQSMSCAELTSGVIKLYRQMIQGFQILQRRIPSQGLFLIPLVRLVVRYQNRTLRLRIASNHARQVYIKSKGRLRLHIDRAKVLHCSCQPCEDLCLAT